MQIVFTTQNLKKIFERTAVAANDLGAAAYAAVVALYANAREHCPSGDLDAADDAFIAGLAEWDGNASALVASLRNARLIEGGYLFGWEDNAARHESNKKQVVKRRRQRSAKVPFCTPEHVGVGAPCTRVHRNLSPGTETTSTHIEAAKARSVDQSKLRDGQPCRAPLTLPQQIPDMDTDEMDTHAWLRSNHTAPSARSPASPEVPVFHAVSGINPEKLRARKATRKVERRAASAETRQSLAEERAALGVTEDVVPAPAIDEGALVVFFEDVKDDVAFREAKRAYSRYRDLADGKPFRGEVPPERVKRLARVCRDEGLSAGMVLSCLHRQAREVAGLPSAPVSMLAPAALDAAAMEARAPKKLRSASVRGRRDESAGRRPLGLVDKSEVDPRVITALRAAKLTTNGLATETEWALAAQANARLRASGRLRAIDVSAETWRAAGIAERALKLGTKEEK